MTKPTHWHFYQTDVNGRWFRALGSHFTERQVADDLLKRVRDGYEVKVIEGGIEVFHHGPIFEDSPRTIGPFRWYEPGWPR